MEETIITYETAKLAQEKGFNVPLSRVFDLGSTKSHYRGWSTRCDNSEFDLNGHKQISAPTQSLLQKWLREVHNIHISVKPRTFNPDTDYVSEILTGPTKLLIYEGDTYEGALERALKSSLILISIK